MSMMTPSTGYGYSDNREAKMLDKAIAHGKEHRRPYRGAKAVFRSCRNHGSCPYCRDNRLHKFRWREDHRWAYLTGSDDR